MNLKTNFELFTNEDITFNINELYCHVIQDLEQNIGSDAYKTLNHKLQTNYTNFMKSLIRTVFLIELVKVPKIESTKFRMRWFYQLEDDPRFCSFEECFEMFKSLAIQACDWLDIPENLKLYTLIKNCSVLPYELPIDYTEELPSSGRIHTLSNISWISDPNYTRDIKTRYYLLNFYDAQYAAFFKKVLTDKVKVKTYLTDRVLTGEHKTNREKRWETNPNSVHFALRKTCADIEYRLMSQIVEFKNFPAEFIQHMQEDGIIHDMNPAFCPITGMELDFNLFKNGIINPVHGKSDFQVGHLTPLKLSKDNVIGRHEASNISWISADGNRIQGSLSVEDTRTMIKQIYNNYEALSW